MLLINSGELGELPLNVSLWEIIFLLENFCITCFDWKGIFALKFRKHDWTELSKVVAGCINKMQLLRAK